MRLVVFLTVLCAIVLRARAAEPDQQKILAILNSVEQRLYRGDITALDDVKTLPGDHAVAGLLMFFKGHFYVLSKETARKAIARKAAIYITECPATADYYKRLFRKDEGRPKSGMLIQMRQAALDALGDANNEFSVALLFELFDLPGLEIPAGDISVALAKMNLDGAPFSRNSQKGARTPEGIAQWKAWKASR